MEPISKNFDINGHDFINPAGSDSIISKLLIDISVKIPAQTARIPLSDEKLGPLGFKGGVKGFDFKSLEAKIVPVSNTHLTLPTKRIV